MAIQNVNSQATPTQQKPANTTSSAQNTSKSATVEKAVATQTTTATSNDPSRASASGVNISPRAKEMALAKKVVENTPDIREDKVAKYKQMIAKGEYKPDSAKITEGIVREAIRDELSKNPDAILNQ